ncbi:MAG: dihydropteroate synthase [Candidatus Hydrogenedentes bacterium]|nr:dihydropteroate synthase [Candidatus Hydrogenedentota bacterium]
MTQGATIERVSGRTLIMGVLNAAPDSFYSPSRVSSPDEARIQARAMAGDGADILDIGGESTRPGSKPIDAAEEQARVLPLLEALCGTGVTISVDTYRSSTAYEATKLGATMINDITALRGDPEMAGVIAESGAECVLMHMQGMPDTMQDEPQYEDVVDDIGAFFEERIAFATREGISESKLWLDPGFGFGKTVGHNLTILGRLGELKRFGLPLIIGTSNKSTIGAVLNAPVNDRMEGTAATVALAIYNGAHCVRVHDVKSMARVARMTDAVAGRISID